MFKVLSMMLNCLSGANMFTGSSWSKTRHLCGWRKVANNSRIRNHTPTSEAIPSCFTYVGAQGLLHIPPLFYNHPGYALCSSQ